MWLQISYPDSTEIELECLAGHFAVDNCSFYLKGAPSFNVMTDHKPLEGIFRKDLFDIGNPRIQRIREKLLEYCFNATWVPVKSHLIADALSRAPLFAPEEIEDIAIDTAHVCLAKTSSGQLDMIFDAIDADYVKLRSDVKSGTLESVYAKQLKLVMSQLSVDEDLVYLDGSHIVLPVQAAKKILPLLHVSHIGMNKNYELSRSMYFWPRMFNDIKQMVSQCRPCNIHCPSQPKNPRISQPPSSYLGPLFEFRGKHHLVYVDQWSGFLMFTQPSSLTALEIVGHLKNWFNLLCWPQSIRSDGGPQFCGDFMKICTDNGIKHELSAPYNPHSNGLAESGVKIIKSILIKYLEEGKDIQRALYAAHVWQKSKHASSSAGQGV